MPDDPRFDKRILQRNLLSGKITQEEYDRYLKRLKDASKDSDVFEASLTSMKRKIPTRIMDEEDDI